MNGDRNKPLIISRTASVTIFSISAATVFLILVIFCLFGCGGSKKSNFYLLSSLTRYSPTAANADKLKVSVGIGPVTIPGYLNRPQIITRSGRYQLEVSDFNRWADSLDASVPRVLAENLSSLLSTDRVYTYPWHDSPPDYEVRLDIIQFDATIPGNVELATRWTLIRGGSETRIYRRKYNNKKPIAGQGYSGMVSTMSLVLHDMSREIADAVILDALRGNTVNND